MSVQMKPTSQIKIRLGIQPNGSVQMFLVHTCRVHMDKYVPFDTGTLAGTVIEEPSRLIYQQPYAKVVYDGVRNGKPINYHKDKHPLATDHWDEKMKSAEIDDVVREVQRFGNFMGVK